MTENNFHTVGYQILKGAISADLAQHFSTEFSTFRQVLLHLHGLDPNDQRAFNDPQITNSFSWYSFVSSESLLKNMLPKMEEITGKQLYPTYSYARIYWPGAEMLLHRDRPACQYSATLTIEEDEENPWPLWMENFNGGTSPLFLKTGDACVYNGMVLDHWREPYLGKKQIQVFLHYVDANGPYAEWKFDKRPFLGLSADTKRN